MRTSIRVVPPPPDTLSRRSQPTPPIVSSLGLAQPRPGPRSTNDYVDSPRARPLTSQKTHVQSPTLIGGEVEVGGGGGGFSHLNRTRSLGGNNHGGGVLHLQQSNTNQQQLSLHQLAGTYRSPHHRHSKQHRGLNTTSHNTTSGLPPNSPVLVVTHQPVSKSPSLKKDIITLDGYNVDGGRGDHQTSWECVRQGGTPVSGMPVSPSDVGTAELSTFSTLPPGVPIGGDGALHSGINCDQCGKCRCRACTERRELPCQAWCCGGKCELNPAKALDVCTCFCAVKCVFYHCLSGQQDDDNECYENPCGCWSTPRCCPRWTILGLMSACLPCLCAYWPARGCLAACTAAYNACCRHKGCQCDKSVKSGSKCHTAVSGGNAGNSAKTCGLSSVRGVGSSGIGSNGEGGNTGIKSSSKHSQARRLLIESDSSSA